jgi:hypothetical protein
VKNTLVEVIHEEVEKIAEKEKVACVWLVPQEDVSRNFAALIVM